MKRRIALLRVLQERKFKRVGGTRFGWPYASSRGENRGRSSSPEHHLAHHLFRQRTGDCKAGLGTRCSPKLKKGEGSASER